MTHVHKHATKNETAEIAEIAESYFFSLRPLRSRRLFSRESPMCQSTPRTMEMNHGRDARATFPQELFMSQMRRPETMKMDFANG
jgi:hypothetical protein